MRIPPRRRVFVSALALTPLAAVAGRQMCGQAEAPAGARTCPDGSIPTFVADQLEPVAPARPPAKDGTPIAPGQPAVERAPSPLPHSNGRGQAAAGEPASLFGVWRTKVPGAAWTAPSEYRGFEWQHLGAGAAAGDLIIKPDGTYVWASQGGKRGRWVHGTSADYPIVLIDTVEHRRWKVGADPKHTGGRDIVVWDGNAFSYDGRR